MSKPSNPALPLAQIQLIFTDIAAKAELIDRAFYHQEDGDDEIERDALAVRLDMIRQIVWQIGAISEFAANELGGGFVRGGFDQWLLSPVYRDQKALIDSLTAKRVRAPEGQPCRT